MNKELVQKILERFQEKETEELSRILDKHDLSEWSEEAFDAIRQILSKRNETKVKIPNLESQINLKELIRIITTSNFISCSSEERKEATKALRRINEEKAVEALLEIGNNESASISIRNHAIRALGEISSPQAVNQLVLLLEDPIETIREETLEALKKIDNPVAKEATEMIRCQACHKNFPQGAKKKDLCPFCLGLNKIKGWLPLFVLGTLLSSIMSFFNGYIISKQSFQDSTLIGAAYMIFGIFFLIGFVFLIVKLPGARVYILSILVIYLIVLIFVFSEILEQGTVVLSIFVSLIYLGYFLRSRRVKVIYRMD